MIFGRPVKLNLTLLFPVVFLVVVFFISSYAKSDSMAGKSLIKTSPVDSFAQAEVNGNNADASVGKGQPSVTGKKNSAENINNMDSEIAKFEAECLASKQKNKFVFNKNRYFNQRYFDFAMYTLNCNAFNSGKENSCDISGIFAENEKAISQKVSKKCKTNFNYYTYLEKAARNPEDCIENAKKFCVNTDFCPDPEKCNCGSTSVMICEFAKINSAAECPKLTAVATKTLKAKERKEDVQFFCEKMLTGFQDDYSKAPQGNDARYTNAVFLTGIFAGKDWPIFSNSVDFEKIHIDPEYIWYFENIYRNKKSCDDQLDRAWEGICKEYALKVFVETQSAKADKDAAAKTAGK